LLDNYVSELWSKVKRGAAGLVLGAGLVLLGANAYPAYAQEQQKVEQADQKTVAYSAAMSAKSIDEKIRLLEEYVKTYNDSQYHKYAFKELAFGYYGKKNYDKVILNGDKALAFTDLDAESKAQLFLVTGEAYVVSPDKKDLGKAVAYANQAKSIATNSGLGEAYLKAANSLESVVEKARGVEKPVSKPDPLSAAKALYNKKDYVGAERALAPLDHKNPDVTYYYGLSLYQNKKYPAAIQGLITASLLDPAKYSKAKDTAQSIFFNYIYKDSKTGKDYNFMVKEVANFAEADIVRLNKEFNDKWEGKEIEDNSTEQEQYKRELDKLNTSIARIKKDALDYNTKLQGEANAAFNRIIEETRKRIGVK